MMKRITGIAVCLLLICLALPVSAVDYVIDATDYKKSDGPRTKEPTYKETVKMWDDFDSRIKVDGQSVQMIYEGVNLPSSNVTADTLAGNEIGYTDGSVMSAKMSPIYSAVLDSKDDIWFIDAHGKTIRMMDSVKGTITTKFVMDERFNLTTEENGINRIYDHSEAVFAKIVYNEENKDLYVAVNHKKNGSFKGLSSIFKITPEVDIITYQKIKRDMPLGPYWMDFIKFGSQGELWFSSRESRLSDPSYLMFAIPGYTADPIGMASWREMDKATFVPLSAGHDEAILTEDNIFVMTAIDSKLTKIQKYPRKMQTVLDFGDQDFFAMTTYKDSFYGINKGVLYQIRLDGSKSTVANLSSVKMNGGPKIGTISHIVFDSNGDLIVFDHYTSSNGSPTQSFIRRINL